MPHVIVKLVPGKSEQQKTRLAEEITKDVMDILHHKEGSVSVSFEEVQAQDWAEKVYRPEILQKPENVYKKPGYNPFDK
jgi:4-oxalocrotonate tautomerase